MVKLPSDWLPFSHWPYWAVWFDFYKWNPIEFIRDCIWIVDKAGHRIKLNIDDPRYAKAQNYFCSVVMRQLRTRHKIRILVLKARQWGCSTLVKALELWLCMFFPNTRDYTAADDMPKSLAMLDKIHSTMSQLPDWLQIATDNRARNHIKFKRFVNLPIKTTSELWVGTAADEDAARSLSLRSHHGTEVAFWGRTTKQVCTAVENAVSDYPGTMVVYESTANGWGGYFYDMVKLARAGRSQFEFVFIPWFWIGEDAITDRDDERLATVLQMQPEQFDEFCRKFALQDYVACNLDELELELVQKHECDACQLLWRRWAIIAKSGGDVEIFNQENPSDPDVAFIAAGSVTFAPNQLRTYANKTSQFFDIGTMEGEMARPVWVDTIKGKSKLYSKPIPEHEYVVSIDPSSGAETYKDTLKEGDNTALVVRDRHAKRVVLTSRSRLPPEKIAEQAALLHSWYNNAMVVVENNSGYGAPIFNVLKRMGCENIYMRKVYDNALQDWTYQYGWQTLTDSRQMMMTTARSVIRNMDDDIPCADLVEELATMVNVALASGGIRQEAKPGCTDDLALAYIIGLHVDREELPPPLELAVETEQKSNLSPESQMVWDAVEAEREEMFGGHDDWLW